MAAGDFLEVYTEKGGSILTHHEQAPCHAITDTMVCLLWVRSNDTRHHTISTRAIEMVTTSTIIIFVLFHRLQAPTILMNSLY